MEEDDKKTQEKELQKVSVAFTDGLLSSEEYDIAVQCINQGIPYQEKLNNREKALLRSLEGERN